MRLIENDKADTRRRETRAMNIEELGRGENHIERAGAQAREDRVTGGRKRLARKDRCAQSQLRKALDEME